MRNEPVYTSMMARKGWFLAVLAVRNVWRLTEILADLIESATSTGSAIPSVLGSLDCLKINIDQDSKAHWLTFNIFLLFDQKGRDL